MPEALPKTQVDTAVDADATVMPARPAATPVAGSAVALSVGTRLGEFEITGLIGEGGFGIVYEARDHSLERVVAIKEYMPTSLASRGAGSTVSVRSENHVETFQTGLRSFVNEAKLLARFEHPSLVKVFRFWEQHGTAYMAMPLYKGVTLKKRLRDMAQPPEEAWLRRILLSVVDALEILHNENIFHRDIAPDNILLVDDDRPVLLDFGAARQVLGDLTHGLTVILKPGYAPLEQYAEVPAMKQGPWTDLYALGAVGYFALAGETPPPAVGRLMSDSMRPLQERAAGRYSDAFVHALDQALQVKPDQRPQNTAAFRALLQADAPAPLSIPKAPPASRSASMKWIGVAVAATLALAVGAFYLQRAFDSTPSLEGSTASTPIAPVEPAAAPAQKPAEEAPPPVRAESASTSLDISSRPTAEPALSAMPAPEAQAPSSAPPNPQPAPEDTRQNEGPEVVRLVALAEKSMSGGDYPAAQRYAQRALKLEAGNRRALEIRRQARDAQQKAFESIRIE